MADTPPVTRKRGKHIEGERIVSARERRYASNDWRDAAELAEKRKKLLRTIPGVTGVSKGEAKRDIREMEACVNMKMLDAEEFSPGDVMATPLPPMPKANQLEAKRARLARWQRDPSVIEKEIAEQKDAVTRAEEKDALMETQRDAWERSYLALRAHLMARHRPTASWSRTSASQLADHASDASSESPVSTSGEVEATGKNNGRVSTQEGDVDGREGGSGRGCGEAEAGVVRGGAVFWSCGGEEEEEASLRELEHVVMKRAGLEGEFDIKQVVQVLSARSRQVMTSRREYASLLAQQQQKSKDVAGNAGAKEHIDLHEAYPGDTALLERWEKLLQSTNGMVDRRAPDGMDDTFHAPWGLEQSLPSSKNANLLIPRGLDLLPSMRAPRYPALLRRFHHQQQQQQQQQQSMEHEATNEKAPTTTEVDDSARGALLAMAKAMEFVPWIGFRDSENDEGVVDRKGVPIDEAGKGKRNDDAAAARVKGCRISERVQWFPRGLPLEMSTPEGGHDERESAHYVSKTKEAMRRLEELKAETARKQSEMELRRQQKVKEALGLVRAAAEHEKRRQEHLRQMKLLTRKLKDLQKAATKRKSLPPPSPPSSSNGPAGDGGDNEEVAEVEAEADQGSSAMDESEQGEPDQADSPTIIPGSCSSVTAVDAATATGAAGSSTTNAGVSVVTTMRSRSPSNQSASTPPSPPAPLATSSTSPPLASSPCSSASGLEKNGGAVGEGRAAANEGGGEKRDGDGKGDDKVVEAAVGGESEEAVTTEASEIGKRSAGGEAGAEVVVRAASKRRRSADAVMAMSANDDAGPNEESSAISMPSLRNAVDHTGSKSKGTDNAGMASGGGGPGSSGNSSTNSGKSKAKTGAGGKRASSARLGSRGRWSGRR